jgi:arylsulfatase
MGQKNEPNILLIFTDQQRWDTLAAYGNDKIKTPNLDRLASQGAVFETAITPCPMCLPARTCAMTGFTAGKLGSLDNRYPSSVDNADTIAGHLRKRGYYSKAIGKMHFSNEPHAESYAMESMDLSEETRGIRFTDDRKRFVYDEYDRFLLDRSLFGWDKPPEIGYNEIKPVINNLPKESHVTQWCGDATVNWLKESRPKDRPFFLWASFVKPHVPYDCPKHLVGFYDERDMGEPWVSDRDGTSKNPYIEQYRNEKEFNLYSGEANRRSKAYYYANITFIDEQVGRILDALDEEGLAESTLVIFTSDHGDLMGDHRLWYKSFGYEGSIRVPLIMRWPGRIAPGSRNGELAGHLDLFPTILAAAGIVDYTPRPGHNLFDFLAGKAVCDLQVSEIMYPPEYMLHIRTKEWKYLFYQNGGYEELYHVSVDPHELFDLSDDQNFVGIKDSLIRRGIAWITENGNPEYALDGAGQLRKETFKAYHEPAARPFSRMPWDYRIPPVTLPESQRGWFWRCGRKDWSWCVRE